MQMYRYKVTGVVQGVGFRPYMFRAMTALGALGYVQNVGDGVVIVTNDTAAADSALRNAPNNIRIDSIEIEEVEETHTTFVILPSNTTQTQHAEIPPDLSICQDCEHELTDTHDRRNGYFFTTCTNCGPRFSIAIDSPYDRDTTTMGDFPMCENCRKEYTDPTDRRYHAQTIACHDCGPTLSLYSGNHKLVADRKEIFEGVRKLFLAGHVVAIKGVGGFHLSTLLVRDAIEQLNTLRNRSNKPYAMMCRDIKMVKQFAEITPEEETSLTSQERPIVLLKKKDPSDETLRMVSELDSVGVLLPYTPLHHLLFQILDQPILMTSSNRAHEPITTTREEQFVPDILDHDRVIANAIDDSVVKVVGGTPLFVRRSRGYVPRSIAIPTSSENILACGAEMNNTFALATRDGRMTLSQHMGNISNVTAFDRYKESIERALAQHHVMPNVILRDLHPTYQSSKHAELLGEKFGVSVVAVQHHRAHVHAVAFEHQLEDFVGIAADGMGYGDDGSIWGGEVFDNNERIGHLETQLLLGGDLATRFPHRMLYAILRNLLSAAESAAFLPERYGEKERRLLEQQYEHRINTTATTSAGRVLDATAALLGLCDERTYDGRPSMLLEANSSEPYPLAPVIENGILSTTSLFEFLLKNSGKDKGRLAATAQYYLAEGLFLIAQQKKKPMVWAGGCAYNRIMTRFMQEQGVLLNIDVPPGDGGISAGQIAAYLASTNTRDNIA